MLLNDAPLPAAELSGRHACLAARQACRLRWMPLVEDMTRLVTVIEPHLRVRR
ncbi:MAG: hypothetical protein ACR2FQ_04950 [Pseudonocardiaceae bacterium]